MRTSGIDLTSMANATDILRVARLLERLILFKRMPIRKLEKELNFSNGYLARIFSGRIELKYRHILDILEAIDVSPKSFFKLAYESDDPDNLSAEDLVGKVGKVSLGAPPPEASLKRSEMEEVVLETLAKLDLLKKTSAKPRRPKTPSKT